MKKHEVIQFIESQITLTLSGASVESNKLDLKRDWYKFKQEAVKAENEFLKDVAAIANSYGYGSGFIVIGVDEKGIPYPTGFEECGLKDVSELYGKIRKRIDRHINIECYDHRFAFEEHNYAISIIHVLPTQDKPHVVSQYISPSGGTHIHEIFIRKGTTTDRATKTDLDTMYSEKNNVLMDRKAYISLSKEYSKFQAHASQLAFSTTLNIENAGYRPLGIAIFEMTVSNPKNPDGSLVFKNEQYARDTFIIPPNGLVKQGTALAIRSSGHFQTLEEGHLLAQELNSFFRHDMAIQDMVLILSDGEALRSVLSIR